MCGFTSRIALSAAISLLTFQAPAHAGNAIAAWVSVAGQDVSGCGSVASPCRSFQYVHDNVLAASGGDILVQGSGVFGPLTITKPVSVVNDGSGTAGIGVSSGQTAILVNTSGAVLLKGLVLDGIAGAANGVYVAGPGNVTIANCWVLNFSQYGVRIAPTGNVKFSITDTLVENNGAGVSVGGSGSGVVSGNLSNDRILGSWTGVEASAAGTAFTIADTQISLGNTGLYADGSGTAVTLRNSTITANTSGYTVNAPAVIKTYGDNVIAANGGNSGTLTPVAPN